MYFLMEATLSLSIYQRGIDGGGGGGAWSTMLPTVNILHITINYATITILKPLPTTV